MEKIHSKELGNLELRTVPISEACYDFSGTYTASGNILLTYRTKEDPMPENWVNIAILNDDGTEFRRVFKGEIKPHSTANGIRWMPFADNKRILLGDYIFECYPNLDQCESVSILPVTYPQWLMESKDLWLHWSEVIISPDNETICWTTLGGEKQGVYIGKLVRTEISYEIDKVLCVSADIVSDMDKRDGHEQFPKRKKGGEVKQFIQGGKAISLVGEGYGIAGPVVHQLDDNTIMPLFNSPGYDETLMFSPDEKFGLIMSTAFSPLTSFEIIGLLPRPFMDLTGLAMPAYMYGVANVRAFRDGNIGPVLVDLKKMNLDRGYIGTDLHDTNEEWIYYSPISWHPNSRKVLWNERKRLKDYHDDSMNHVPCRLRICELKDKKPSSPISVDSNWKPSYFMNGEDFYTIPNDKEERSFRINGNHSGYIERTYIENRQRSITTIYSQYSEDGKTIWNGQETLITPNGYIGTSIFEGKVTATGEIEGEMDIRLQLSYLDENQPVRIQTDRLSDGSDASYGFARYANRKVEVRDLL